MLHDRDYRVIARRVKNGFKLIAGTDIRMDLFASTGELWSSSFYPPGIATEIPMA